MLLQQTLRRDEDNDDPCPVCQARPAGVGVGEREAALTERWDMILVSYLSSALSYGPVTAISLCIFKRYSSFPLSPHLQMVYKFNECIQDSYITMIARVHESLRT